MRDQKPPPGVKEDDVVMPIRVLIIDQSPLVRVTLKEILQQDPGIAVVGSAIDPYMARDRIKALEPDVLTLAIQLPRMDGITFLSNLMRLHPMPVVMISSLTEEGADETHQALALGAVDYVTKPKLDLAENLKRCGDEIISKLKTAAATKVEPRCGKQANSLHVEQKHDTEVILPKRVGDTQNVATEPLIAIGASTGGTEAIKDVLAAMPANSPAIVITQHIPSKFSKKFAERMNHVCQLNVCQATHGQQIKAGHVYIAPGDRHLLIRRSGPHYYCELNDGLAVNRHKPAVDVLFRSTAQSAGRNAMGVLLTGMGEDGAKGLKELQEAGAMTIAQDEASSLVWGMPGAAVRLNAADYVLPLSSIANMLKNHINKEKNNEPVVYIKEALSKSEFR